jgi:hypothetical protein
VVSTLISTAWVRFELTKDFRPWRFSRPLPSTTRPPRLEPESFYRTGCYTTPLSFLQAILEPSLTELVPTAAAHRETRQYEGRTQSRPRPAAHPSQVVALRAHTRSLICRSRLSLPGTGISNDSPTLSFLADCRH